MIIFVSTSQSQGLINIGRYLLGNYSGRDQQPVSMLTITGNTIYGANHLDFVALL